MNSPGAWSSIQESVFSVQPGRSEAKLRRSSVEGNAYRGLERSEQEMGFW